MKHSNILLVDDDKNFLRILTHNIQELGFHASPTSSAEEALERLKVEKVDLVVTDLRMTGMDGLELMAEIHKRDPNLPVVVLTAYGSIDKAVEATRRGAFDFLTKPFEKEKIHQTIINALKMAQLLKENRVLTRAVSKKFEFQGIIGSSKKFQEVLELARQLSEVETTVLIQGESGTGKEILAQAIHFNSPRKREPFVTVNCGAIPENLLESELFGYKKGAFTGAVSDKKGKVEVAESGTVFLDEVGELPLNMQVKLLRLIQQKEIDAVGFPHPRPVDVRIVAASNKDLAHLLGEGLFREDLYYRLSVAPLWIPPLRERREDIPLLLHHFLKEMNHRLGKKVSLEPDAVTVLQQYNWPGNIRELENIVERLVIFDKQGVVRRADLPVDLYSPAISGKVSFQLPQESFSLEELECNLLRAALEKHNWNQTRAAQYLEITRNTLIYRMQKYHLSHHQPAQKASGKPL